MAKTILTDLNLHQNELQNAVVQNLAAAPLNPEEGQIYYNTTEHKTYQWNGTEWTPLYQGGFATNNEAITGTATNLLMNPANTKAAIDAAVEEVETAGEVTLESADGGANDTHIKSYTIKQGGTTVGTINIPKDLVVQSGALVIGTLSGSTFTAGDTGTTYLKLVIANQSAPIYINVADLVDTYTAGYGITISGGQISIDSSILAAYSKTIKIDNPQLTPSNGVVLWDISTELGGLSAQKSVVQVYNNEEMEVIVEIKRSNGHINIIFNSSTTVAANRYHAIITSVI